MNAPNDTRRASAPRTVFINYRREDAAAHAGRLRDNLCDYLGAEHVFMDVESIAAGADYVDVLDEAVRRCDVLLALIGGRWLAAASDSGRRRIDDPADFVHREIATALASSVRVIPVLVQGAAMPGAAELPAPLEALSRRQAFRLRDESWRQDVARLAVEIDPRVAERHGRGARRWRLPVAFAAAAVILAAVAALYLWPDRRKLVLVMDSYAKDVVYDKRTRDNDETNAHEIERILEPYRDQIRVDRQVVGRGVPNNRPFVEKNPDLVIIHKSSFYGTTVEGDPAGRLSDFLRDMTPTKAKFLIYTRSVPSDEAEKERWKAQLIEQTPELKDRVELFTFDKEPVTFLDRDVAARLISRVKAILNLR